MEVRVYAERVLLSDSLADKITAVEGPFTDEAPGEAVDVREPARPGNLQFAPRRTAPAMPKPGALVDPARRAVAHHILANHELQALEVMARVALLFPDAPSDFRIGLAKIMQDEQRHTRMHIERAAMLGLTFGDLPVNCYIWKKSLDFESVLDYLATLPLVFENRNLDHSLEFAAMFEAAGDDRSAALARVIHNDEIEHVRFGLEWLRKLKPDAVSDWDAFTAHLKWPLRPSKAKGEEFQYEARREAGMTDEFIDRLRAAIDEEATATE
ncbi:MAG: ferritin-like domain-containing protein [Planctomycetota bacterium]|jgi:uncharacterized ferritin-like protein (DUF455 family)